MGKRAKASTHGSHRGIGGWHVWKRKADATREAPVRGRGDKPNRKPARDRPGALRVTERPVGPLKPGNAGGGKGPWFEGNVEAGKDGDWAT